MYSYLSTVTPDYITETLDITPDKVITASGEKNQVQHEMDDGTLAVVTLSATSTFEVVLQWDFLTSAEYTTIMDLYHNPLKANGSDNTFPWVNPTDEKRYTARFLDKLKITKTTDGVTKTSTIRLRIEGNYPL
jgi:hypothetical protein